MVAFEDGSSTVAVIDVPESFLCRIEAIEMVSVAAVGKDVVERVIGEEEEEEELGASIKVDVVVVVAVDALAMGTSFGGSAVLVVTPSMREGIGGVVAAEAVYCWETREGVSVMGIVRCGVGGVGGRI